MVRPGAAEPSISTGAVMANAPNAGVGVGFADRRQVDGLPGQRGVERDRVGGRAGIGVGVGAEDRGRSDLAPSRSGS